MADTVKSFAEKIRSKYPGAYDSWDDSVLVSKFVEKYPVYKSWLDPVENVKVSTLSPSENIPELTPEQIKYNAQRDTSIKTPDGASLNTRMADAAANLSKSTLDKLSDLLMPKSDMESVATREENGIADPYKPPEKPRGPQFGPRLNTDRFTEAKVGSEFQLPTGLEEARSAEKENLRPGLPPEPGLVERMLVNNGLSTLGQFTSGGASLTEMVGQHMSKAGRRGDYVHNDEASKAIRSAFSTGAHYLGQVLEDSGYVGRGAGNKLTEEFGIKDPDNIDKFSSAMWSMAALAAPTGMASRMLISKTMLKKISEKLAADYASGLISKQGFSAGMDAVASHYGKLQMLNAALLSPVETLVDSGMSREEAIRRGMNNEQADKVASYVFKTELAPNLVMNKAGVFAEKGGVARRMLLGGAMEGLQESAVQQTVQNKAIGNPVEEGQLESFIFGALPGMALGGVDALENKFMGLGMPTVKEEGGRKIYKKPDGNYTVVPPPGYQNGRVDVELANTVDNLDIQKKPAVMAMLETDPVQALRSAVPVSEWGKLQALQVEVQNQAREYNLTPEQAAAYENARAKSIIMDSFDLATDPRTGKLAPRQALMEAAKQARIAAMEKRAASAQTPAASAAAKPADKPAPAPEGSEQAPATPEAKTDPVEAIMNEQDAESGKTLPEMSKEEFFSWFMKRSEEKGLKASPELIAAQYEAVQEHAKKNGIPTFDSPTTETVESRPAESVSDEDVFESGSLKYEPKDNSNVEAAIKELASTHQMNPLDSREMVSINSQTKDDRGYGITVRPFDGKIYLAEVRALNKMRSGEGTRAMTRLLEVADKHNVSVLLNVAPLGKGGMNDAQLAKWYTKLGFVDKGRGLMERPPHGKSDISKDEAVAFDAAPERETTTEVSPGIAVDKEGRVDSLAPSAVDESPMRESGDPDENMARSVASWYGSEDMVEGYAKAAGIPEETFAKWRRDVDSVARMVTSRDILYEASEVDTALKPNKDYIYSLDFSTLCRKRLKLQASLEAAQMNLGRMLNADEWIRLRNLMKDAGDVVSCGLCYVESKRMIAGEQVNKVIERHPDIPKEYFLTQEGLTKLKAEKPEVYSEVTHAFSLVKAKMQEARTEYRNEILESFGDGSKRAKADIAWLNGKSGMRWQSWSDFEVPHLIDAMQAILDMHVVGLMGHAYTKVPDFVRAMGRTGMMINMSLIPLGSGLDAKGNLVFDPVEGMDFDEALSLRREFSNTAGTIAVGVNDAHIKALLADDRIDYVIPYHHSGLGPSKRKAMGMATWDDYSSAQLPKCENRELNAKFGGKENGKGKWVAAVPKFSEHHGDVKKYRALCEEMGLRPAFDKFLDLPGAWKLLVDRKTYNAEGKRIKQEPVKPEYDMVFINKMLKAYTPEKAAPSTAAVKKLLKEIQDGTVPVVSAEVKAELFKDEVMKYDPKGSAFWDHLGYTSEELVKQKMPNRASSDQIRSILKNGGVTADEMDWLGLNDFLGDGPAMHTKEEVLSHINENKMRMQDEVRGVPQNRLEYIEKTLLKNGMQIETDMDGQVTLLHKGTNNLVDFAKLAKENPNLAALVDEYANGEDVESSKRPRWKQYATRGGRSYREFVFTLPGQIRRYVPDTHHFTSEGGGTAVMWARVQDHNIGGPYVVTVKRAGSSAKGRAGTSTKTFPTLAEAESFMAVKRAGGFETEVKSSGRTLVVEEIQSKRHQDAEKKGYTLPEREHRKAVVENVLDSIKTDTAWWETANDEQRKKLESVLDTYKDGKLGEGQLETEMENMGITGMPHEYIYREQNTKVPTAPLKKTWPFVALKRMLHYAITNGYEGFAWVDGTEQANRYNLSKVVNSVEWKPVEPDTSISGDEAISILNPDMGGKTRHEYWSTLEQSKRDEMIREARKIKVDDSNSKVYLNIEGSNGGEIQDAYPKSQLADIVGKELAGKILASPKGKISGLDLSVGGEGMKKFYDRDLVEYMNKLLKKMGGKVERQNLNFSAKATAGAITTGELRELGLDRNPITIMHMNGVIVVANTVTEDTKEFPDTNEGYMDAVAYGDEITAKIVAAAKAKGKLGPGVHYVKITPNMLEGIGSRLFDAFRSNVDDFNAEEYNIAARGADGESASPEQTETSKEPVVTFKQASTYTGLRPKVLKGLGQVQELGLDKIAKRREKEIAESLGHDYSKMTVTGIHDIALIGAKMARHPFFEHMAIIYVKDTPSGEQVIHTGLHASGLPGAVKIDMLAIDQTVRDINADGFYIIHNHPSGNPLPSEQDITCVNSLLKRGEGLSKVRGGIVLDHTRFAFIKPGTEASPDQQEFMDFASPLEAYRTSAPAVLSNPAMMDYIKGRVSGEFMHVVGLDAYGKVMSVIESPYKSDLTGLIARSQKLGAHTSVILGKDEKLKKLTDIRSSRTQYDLHPVVLVAYDDNYNAYRVDYRINRVKNIRVTTKILKDNAAQFDGGDFGSQVKRWKLEAGKQMTLKRPVRMGDSVVPRGTKVKLVSVDPKGVDIIIEHEGKRASVGAPAVLNIAMPKPQPVDPGMSTKQVINMATGVNSVAPKMATEMEVLTSLLQREERAGREGYRLGQRDMYSRMLKKYSGRAANAAYNERWKSAEIITKITDSAAEVSAMKKDVLAYAKKALPQSELGRFVNALLSVKTERDAIKVLIRVEERVSHLYRRGLLSDIKKKLSRAIDSPSVDVKFKEQVRSVIDGFDFTQRRADTIEKLKAWEKYISDQRAIGKDIFVARGIFDQVRILSRVRVEDMTEEQLERISRDITVLDSLGRQEAFTNKVHWILEAQRLKKELAEGIKKPLMRAPDMMLVGRLAQILQDVDVYILPVKAVMDVMDGSPGYTGPVVRNLADRVDSNFRRYLLRADSAIEPVAELASKLNLSEADMEWIGLYAMRVQFNGVERLVNMGYDPDFVSSIELTEPQKQVYDLMRSTMDGVFPEVQELMRDLYNEEVFKVENYFPFITDFSKMSDIEVYDRVKDMTGAGRRSSISHGYTRSRLPFAKGPIKINAIDIFNKHMDNVMYFLEMQRDIVMLNQVVRSEEVSGKLGDFGVNYVADWLDLLAKKGGDANAKRIQLLDWIRNNIGSAYLGFKLSSMLIQPTALLDGMSMLGGETVTRGCFAMSDKATRVWLLKNFPEFKHRIGDDVAFSELGFSEMMKKMQSMGYAGLKFMDGLASGAITYGAYLKALKAQGIDEVDLNAPINEEAYKYAVLMNQRTQASPYFKDLGLAFTRGAITKNRSLEKFVLQFQSFSMNRWSLLRHDLPAMVGRGDYRGASMMLGFLTTAVIAETGLRSMFRAAKLGLLAMAGMAGDDDQFNRWAREQEDSFAHQAFLNALQSVPVAGMVIQGLEYKENPIPGVAATQDIFGTAGKLYADISNGDPLKTRDVVKTMAAIATLAGVPGTLEISTSIDTMLKNKRLLFPYQNEWRHLSSIKRRQGFAKMTPDEIRRYRELAVAKKRMQGYNTRYKNALAADNRDELEVVLKEAYAYLQSVK